MSNDLNESSVKVGEFNFLTNKSFFGRGSPITIPSRLYESIKGYGVKETTPALVKYANEDSIKGSIYVGWRAGGKYFQIRVTSSEPSGLSELKLGVSLRVGIYKNDSGWLIEMR
jgi:hypothetical protein